VFTRLSPRQGYGMEGAAAPEFDPLARVSVWPFVEPSPAQIMGPHLSAGAALVLACFTPEMWKIAIENEERFYLRGREPAMRMSTSLLALCCQSAPEPTCETPIRARSRSNASRSLRRSPLFLARFTSSSIALWILVREPS
jgi:hypothetical protein